MNANHNIQSPVEFSVGLFGFFCHDKMTLNSRVSYLGNHGLHYLLCVIKFKRSEFYQSSPSVCFHKWRFSVKLTANMFISTWVGRL